jgi:hypothetical protein
MKKMVIVDLSGGLGNQIFLFEAARYIASINNSRILVNKSNIDRYHSAGKSRIEDFVFPDDVKFFKFSSWINKFYIRFRIFITRFNNYNQSLSLILDESYNLYESNQIYRMVFQKNPRLIIISGFWQNFSYLNNIFGYKLKSEGKKFLELSSKIDSQHPIIFHYRLGKIGNRWEHGWGALSPKFLSNALMALGRNNPTFKNIWVFSNDLPEAKILTETISYAPYKLIYIDDSELSPAELILLFSRSKIMICSNSTFSILAAKIGNVKHVLVPSELSKNGHNTFELPAEWRKVKSVWLD